MKSRFHEAADRDLSRNFHYYNEAADHLGFDGAFVAEVPELPGCMADGPTYEDAVAAVKFVIREWIEMAHELGRAIPEPKGRLLYA